MTVGTLILLEIHATGVLAAGGLLGTDRIHPARVCRSRPRLRRARYAIAHGPRDAVATVPDDWREIAFDDVSFVYQGGTRALDHVSFRIRAWRDGGARRAVGGWKVHDHQPAASLLRADRGRVTSTASTSARTSRTHGGRASASSNRTFTSSQVPSPITSEPSSTKSVRTLWSVRANGRRRPRDCASAARLRRAAHRGRREPVDGRTSAAEFCAGAGE